MTTGFTKHILYIFVAQRAANLLASKVLGLKNCKTSCFDPCILINPDCFGQNLYKIYTMHFLQLLEQKECTVTM